MRLFYNDQPRNNEHTCISAIITIIVHYSRSSIKRFSANALLHMYKIAIVATLISVPEKVLIRKALNAFKIKGHSFHMFDVPPRYR